MPGESKTQHRRSRWYRSPRQRFLFGLTFAVTYVVVWGVAQNLHGNSVDIPTLLKFGAIVVPIVVAEILALPWIVAAVKWVFRQ